MERESNGHKIVRVTWTDSCADFGWRKLASVEPDQFSTIDSVGWLVRDDKRSITITTSVSSVGSCMDPLVIPKVAIVKLRRIG